MGWSGCRLRGNLVAWLEVDFVPGFGINGDKIRYKPRQVLSQFMDYSWDDAWCLIEALWSQSDAHEFE